MYLFGKSTSGGSPPAAPKANAGAEFDLSRLAERLSIPCPSPTSEDRARDEFWLRGRFLARQERWTELVEEVRQADAARRMTPAAMPVADLLCYGARSDVVAAVEHALVDGCPETGTPLCAGIEALEEMLAEAPHDPVRAIVVAQAHIDVAWAWRGSEPDSQVPRRHLEAFAAHFDRARDILSECGNRCSASPLFLSTLCTLDASGIVRNVRFEQQYEALIDLNPMCPAYMRSLGCYVSPRWHGTHEDLELEARRTAARTHGVWGAGGYTWVMFDALAGDPTALAQLDVVFFVEGVWDILERLNDQHTANTLAAYCAVTLGSRACRDVRAETHRAEIAACAGRIVRHHLNELHPMVWAHAAAGFDNSLRVPSPRRFAARGRHQALCKIAELFSAELAAGNRIVFTSQGPVAELC